MTKRLSSRGLDPAKIVKLRYELWSRMCALADEAMSIADAWWESDPEIAQLHHRRCESMLELPPIDEPWHDSDDVDETA